MPFIDWKFICGDHDFLNSSDQGVSHTIIVMTQLSIPNEHEVLLQMQQEK